MYTAIICKIKVFPIPNANKIQMATCAGYTVLVGNDHKDGELGIFFPSDGQISWNMLQKNKLHRNDRGYLENNRRIKTIKLMGIKSEGLWLPISSLEWASKKKDKVKPIKEKIININKIPSELKEGDVLTNLNGHHICNKYVTSATAQKTPIKKSLLSRIKASWSKFRNTKLNFPKHFDTEKLQYALLGKNIPIGTPYYVTLKLHGTSQRSGYVKSKSLIRSITEKLGLTKPKYVSVCGTRNLTLPHKSCKDLYRPIAHKIFVDKLNKDEIVYYEIVGYGEQGSSIMSSHKISDKKFSSPMYYSYGMKPTVGNEIPEYGKHFDIYVYRITQKDIDLSPSEIDVRCAQLGLKVVPSVIQKQWNGNVEELLSFCKKLTEMNSSRSQIDSSHIEEGVCIRFYGWKENEEVINFTAKYKSWLFCDCEGIAKNSDEYIDVEEIEEVALG